MFAKSLQYVKHVSRYSNPDAVKQVREVLARNQLHEFELCVIGEGPSVGEKLYVGIPEPKSWLVIASFSGIPLSLSPTLSRSCEVAYVLTLRLDLNNR